DIELRALRERLADGRGDAGAQRDGVALAVLETLDADLPLVDRERRPVLTADCDKWRKIGAPPREILGELETGAWRRRVSVDRIVEEAEAMVPTHALVLQAHVGDLAEVEGKAHGVECRTPELTVGGAAPDHEQRLSLLGGRPRAQIADIGGSRRALEQRRAL